jgi:hypothetical protein
MIVVIGAIAAVANRSAADSGRCARDRHTSRHQVRQLVRS